MNGPFLQTLDRLGPEQSAGGKMALRPLPMAAAPPPPDRVVLVAGTNGKGSTSFYLGELLQQAGWRTLVYLSPHLVSPNERFLLDGHPLPLTLLDEATTQLMKKTGGPPPLTYFEFLTALSPLCARLAGADWLIAEVGLGGAMDATNALPHRWCVLTGIGRDHVGVLGETAQRRLVDKLGIVGHDNTVVLGTLPGKLAALAHTTVRGRGGQLADLPTIRTATTHGHTQLNLGGHRLRLHHDYPPLVHSATLALRTATVLAGQRLPEDLLLTRHLPARCQVIPLGAGGPLVVDGAHNPQAMAALARYLAHRFEGQSIALAYAQLRRKEAGRTIAALCRHLRPTQVWLPGPWLETMVHDIAHPPDVLTRHFARYGVPTATVDGMNDLLRHLGEHKGPKVLTGSLHFAGAVLPHLSG